MERFVLRHRKRIIGFLALCLTVGMVTGPLPLTQRVVAQETEDDDVTVTATIQTWLNFEIDNLNLTLDQDLVDSAGDTYIGTTSTALMVGTNNALGWNIQIQGTNGGLLQEGGSHLISTVSGSATLEAGTDGYGATIEDLGNLGALTVVGNYAEAANFAGEVASSSPIQVVSYSDPHVNTNVANFRVRAAASAITPSGDYKDTITITATAPIE